MSKASKDVNEGRRQFMKGMAVIGGTTVFVAVSREALVAAPDEPQAPATAEASQGYHLTAHIATYYDKARF